MGHRLIVLMALSAISLLQAGCSAGGEISDIIPKQVVSGIGTQGLISGATAYEKTAGGYVVSSSVGAWNSGELVQTTAGGYKVYQNVQGVLSAQ